MSSNNKHLKNEQQQEESIDQSREIKSPSYLEGTPVISEEETKNGLMDRDEIESNEDDDDIVMGTEADVTPEERALLDDTLMFGTTDDENLRRSALDNTDYDGEPLNEASFGEDISGNDLDIPGSELDDDTEMLGEEDEENNAYSLGGDGHDDVD